MPYTCRDTVGDRLRSSSCLILAGSFSLRFFLILKSMVTFRDTVGNGPNRSQLFGAFPRMSPLLHEQCSQGLQYSLDLSCRVSRAHQKVTRRSPTTCRCIFPARFHINRHFLSTTAPCSRINAYFATVIWFIFNLRKEKNYQTYIHYIKRFFMILLLCTASPNIALLELLACSQS